jgi:hypothetical protein
MDLICPTQMHSEENLDWPNEVLTTLSMVVSVSSETSDGAERQVSKL